MYLSYGHKKNFVPHGPAAGVISIFPGWGGASRLFILHAQVATCVSYSATQQHETKTYTYIIHILIISIIFRR